MRHQNDVSKSFYFQAPPLLKSLYWNCAVVGELMRQ